MQTKVSGDQRASGFRKTRKQKGISSTFHGGLGGDKGNEFLEGRRGGETTGGLVNLRKVQETDRERKGQKVRRGVCRETKSKPGNADGG